MTDTLLPPLLSARKVRKSFGGVEVLKGISLDVAAGQVMCLLGPSGSGKSTFLRCINHLERIDGGRISVDGELIGYAARHGRIFEMNRREVARQRGGIGMVFQRFNLFPQGLPRQRHVTRAAWPGAYSGSNETLEEQ